MSDKPKKKRGRPRKNKPAEALAVEEAVPSLAEALGIEDPVIEVELETPRTPEPEALSPTQMGTTVFSDFSEVVTTHICPVCQTEIETIGHGYPRMLCSHCRLPMATKDKRS